MTNVLKAVLFDVDGTLIDSEAIQSEAYLMVLRFYGHDGTDLTEHGTVHIPGEPTDATWARLKTKHDISADTAELTAKKRQAAMDVLTTSELQAMKGVETLIRACRLHGLKIAAVSSAQMSRLTLILDGLDLSQYIDVIVSANDVANVKPHPEPLTLAADKLNVQPNECVVIGDSIVDIEAAKAADMKVVAVPNQYTKLMDFSAADLRVTSLRDLSYDILSAM